MRKHARWVLIWVATLLVAGSGCESGPSRKPESVDGKVYGVTSGAFRGRWWNYYERGISYGDGHLWVQEEADLRDALQQRSQDQRRARTYGMHFLDYFPHRELGVALYHQGKYEEAIQEFEASLKDEKSAKAEFYLDCSRKALIRQQKADLRPPEIEIWSPLPDLLTNAFSVGVSGVIRDDSYVKDIKVNGRPIRLDLAAPTVPFDLEVPLEPGENVIRIETLDLSDKQTVAERRIRADWEGPVLSLEDPLGGNALGGTGTKLRGYVSDDTGLKEITVDGRQLLHAPTREFRLDYTLPSAPGREKVVIQATDLAGNRTTAEIRLAGGQSLSQRVLLASLEPSHLALLGSAPAQDALPPSIELKNYTEAQETFQDHVYLEGVVRDEGGVGFLAVNGQSILRKSGKSIYFSHLAKLDEGENCFLIEARDLAGNRMDRKVCIHRKLNKAREIGSRLSVALLPFERKGGPGLALDTVEETLLAELISGHRFRMVERRRLEEILREHRVGGSDLADPGAAIRIGRIMAATCVLMGSVLEKEGSIEIYLRAVDTETSLILTAVDVYGEDLSPEMVRTLCRGLMLKLLDELPLVEGLVVTVKGNQGIIDLGSEKKVKKGMRVIVFEEGEAIRHPLTGIVLGSDVTEMGRGLIQAVRSTMSDVELLGKEAPQRVKPMHKVITQ
jgi:hypothetical protein